jgi:flagellar basal-body rod protein FlgB
MTHGWGSSRTEAELVGLFDVTQIALERALSGASQRQQILANNLANADTPGFKRTDLDFHSQLAMALESTGSSDQLASQSFETQTDTSTSMQADGNNVDVDTEMSKLSQNALDYQSLISITNARFKMLSTAIGLGQ